MPQPAASLLPPQSRGWLARLNPLAKLLAPAPAMIALVFVRDLATPLAFVGLAYLVLLSGAPVTRRLALLLFVALPVAVAGVGVGLSLWTDPARVGQDVVVLRIGAWTLYGGAVEVGIATALRLAAIVALALIGGVTTTGPDLVRALVQQLRVPYRVGYTALAALRFVPRLGRELELIRQAHRVRGASAGRGPLASLRRGSGYVVPLLAGAIRHAERVALAMDARAFGAYPDRTERFVMRWRVRDTFFVVAFCALSAAIIVVLLR